MQLLIVLAIIVFLFVLFRNKSEHYTNFPAWFLTKPTDCVNNGKHWVGKCIEPFKSQLVPPLPENNSEMQEIIRVLGIASVWNGLGDGYIYINVFDSFSRMTDFQIIFAVRKLSPHQKYIVANDLLNYLTRNERGIERDSAKAFNELYKAKIFALCHLRNHKSNKGIVLDIPNEIEPFIDAYYTRDY